MVAPAFIAAAKVLLATVFSFTSKVVSNTVSSAVNAVPCVATLD